ncbi:hypothetical protein PILCRDRAFT_55864, partial [Piloderma croceum F 1598]
IKHHIASLSGIIPLAHNMCINTCIAYTGSFRYFKCCPYCDKSCYNTIQLAASNRKKKEPCQQLYTMPIGLQLQALYCSKNSAQHMCY